MDAPARTRAAWQAAVAPIIGLAAALGVLTGASPVLAVVAMAIVGAAAGYCFSVSLRLSIAGLSVALSLLIAQGLPLEADAALPALLLATAGGLLQAALLAARLRGRRSRGGGRAERAGARAARCTELRRQPDPELDQRPPRGALRRGAGDGVAAYWLLGMEEHGFWIPLTILFVLRPEQDETLRRLVLRAAGTAAGLIVASLLSEWLHGDPIALALVLTVATAFAYGLLTVQYALFTAAITTYAVLLADTLGEPALDAAGQRAGATGLGILIAGAAFLLWSNPGEGRARVATRAGPHGRRS